MKARLLGLFLMTALFSFTTFAGQKIVNSHFSKKSLIVQIQNDQTGSTKWISFSKVGVINTTLGCEGLNCTARNLKKNKDGLYADVLLSIGSEIVLEDVYLLNFYEDTLIDPSDLKLSYVDNKPILSIIVK